MTDTAIEIQQQEVHEHKMRTDLEYAFEHISNSVFSSPDELAQFIEDHQLLPVIAADFFLAIKEAKGANVRLMNKDFSPSAVNRRSMSRSIVSAAVGRIRSVIDSKIEDIAGGHQ